MPRKKKIKQKEKQNSDEKYSVVLIVIDPREKKKFSKKWKTFRKTKRFFEDEISVPSAQYRRL